MGYNIRYKSSVAGDLKKLDEDVARRIIEQLEMKLSENPDSRKALKGQFRGLYSYRIGDYRVAYTKIRDGNLVLRIGHRAPSAERTHLMRKAQRP